MTNGTLNTYLLKKQQEEILELTTQLEFFMNLCKELSAPIEKPEK